MPKALLSLRHHYRGRRAKGVPSPVGLEISLESTTAFTRSHVAIASVEFSTDALGASAFSAFNIGHGLLTSAVVPSPIGACRERGEKTSNNVMAALRKPLFILQHRSPTLIRIESIDRCRKLNSIWTEILLVDHTIVTHHEGLNACKPVLCGKCNRARSHRSLRP